MQVFENFSLKNYNTFGIAAKARHFVSINSVNQLQNVLLLKEYPKKLIFGGGSNMLITKDVDALVIHINLKGKEIINKNDGTGTALVKAWAGENWHEFVLWTLENNFGGLENLSLIPGNVGSAPIQNIGAYGVELKDTFESCEALEIKTGKIKTFLLQDCRFGYRDSVFKGEAKNQFIILNVTFRLTTKNHQIKTSYGAIEETLNEWGITNPNVKNISDAVIAIRKSKLPDPAEIGNSGSFFKNPVVGKKEFEKFAVKHPNAPFFKVSEDEIKIPAGWLIEQAGFKGARFGDAGVHAKQALVLVNYGNATGSEIWDLAMQVQKTVHEKFGILIEPEVNIL